MANVFMTVVEASVPAERWADLEQNFARIGAAMPAALSQTFLTQDSADPTHWRLLGVWPSRAAFDEYRASVATPAGVLIFREIGAEPTLRAFEIKGQHTA